MILGLFSELLATGGVQRVSRHTAAVLKVFADNQNVDCQLFSLNDSLGYHDLQVGDIALTVRGFGRRKLQFALAVLVRVARVHLAYIGHPNLSPLGLLLKFIRPSTCYWVATYGIDVWRPLPLLRRLGLRWAHGVTVISRFTAEKLGALNKLEQGKVQMLPPALDPTFLRKEKGAASSRLGLPSGRLLLTVARLASAERYKGMETVILALPKVLEDFPDTFYVIIGEGDEQERLEHIAKEIGVEQHVIFPGAQGVDRLIDYYSACDIFVMPSRKEGFGIVFLEAMTFGKPVIGGKHGGTPEVVKDGVTGYLVEFGDTDVLANRLVRLLGNKDLRERMGEAGRRHVENNYTFEHFRRRLLQLLTGGDSCES